MGTSFSPQMMCYTAISRNDLISLANEIYKLLENSRSDGPFEGVWDDVNAKCLACVVWSVYAVNGQNGVVEN